MIAKKHTFSEDFKKVMVTKLLQLNGPSVLELSNKQGVSKSALYNWLKTYSSIEKKDKSMPVTNINNIPNYQNASFKLKAIIETNNLTEEEIGIYCRKNGIYSSKLLEWKQQCLNSFEQPMSKKEYKEYRQKCSSLEKNNKKLQSELNRKDKALAEASALLILQKKASLIWGGNQAEE